MYIERFDTGQHLPILHDWLRARDAYLPPPEEMPANGFIIYEGFTPVATAFLRLVEGGFAQLDTLATDGSLPAELRDKAIDELVGHTIKHAKVMKLKGLIAHSLDNNTLVRSKRHGFVVVPQTIIALNLGKV